MTDLEHHVNGANGGNDAQFPERVHLTESTFRRVTVITVFLGIFVNRESILNGRQRISIIIQPNGAFQKRISLTR